MNRTIEKFSVKNLIVFAVLVAIVTFVLSSFIIYNYSDVKNFFFAPFEFDLERALEETPLINMPLREIPANQSTVTIEQTLIATHGSHSVQGYQTTLQATRYNQSGRYLFEFAPNEIYDLNMWYTFAITSAGMPLDEGSSHRYILTRLDDAMIFVRLRPNENLSVGDTITGVFVPFPQYLIDNFITTHAADFDGYLENMFVYVFDTTRDFGFERLNAFIMSLLSLLLILWLIYKLISQIFNKQKRYLYKKIALFNGDVAVINEQLKTAKVDGKNFITEVF